MISAAELVHRYVAVNDGSDSDSDPEYTDSSSEYSSTDSDEDENSENYQACRQVFEYIDEDNSGIIDLDEILDTWHQLVQVRYNNRIADVHSVGLGTLRPSCCGFVWCCCWCCCYPPA